MSQQCDLTTGIGDSFSGQQSLTLIKDSFVLPLLRQTILLAVNPRLDTRNIAAKKTEIIFWKTFIDFTKIRQFH